MLPETEWSGGRGSQLRAPRLPVSPNEKNAEELAGKSQPRDMGSHRPRSNHQIIDGFPAPPTSHHQTPIKNRITAKRTLRPRACLRKILQRSSDRRRDKKRRHHRKCQPLTPAATLRSRSSPTLSQKNVKPHVEGLFPRPIYSVHHLQLSTTTKSQGSPTGKLEHSLKRQIRHHKTDYICGA